MATKSPVNKAATHHWWMQRVTAMALVPLTIWFVVSLIAHLGVSYEEVRNWVSSPAPAVLLIMLAIATFYHAALGLQEVIADYIANVLVRRSVSTAANGICLFFGALSVFSVLKIGFGG